MARYGSRRYGGFPYGALKINDTPVVSFVTPTAGQDFTVGPSISFEWTYSQAQSMPQATFRLLIYDTVAEGNIWYDSGVVSSAATVFDVDLVANAVPTDRLLWAMVIVTSTDGPGYSGAVTAQFQVDFGGPSAVITSPTGGAVITDPQVGLIWTYSDTDGLPEAASLVQLFTAEGASLYSSGWVAGGPDQATIPFNLTSGSGYKATVTVKNTNGVISSPAIVFFSAANIVVPPGVLDSVGSVYNVAVNGVGYMLYEDPVNQADLTRSRGAVSLDPPRLATSSTPFSEAVERYSFVPSADWRAGSGQRWGSKTDSNPARFYDSLGINPFEPYELTLLPDSLPQMVVTAPGCQAVVANDRLYALNGSNQLQELDNPDGASTFFSVAAANALLDIASDGQNWYVNDGVAGIWRNNAPTDPGAPWSSIAVQVIGWAGQRICGAYKSLGSSTPNVFTTFNTSGAEEIGGGRLVLDKGWTITDFTGGSGFVWFAAYAGNKGVVYKWDLTAAGPSVALELPIGEIPRAIFWYQGQVFVRAEHPKTATDSSATIYRCIAQSSSLSASGTGNLDPHFLCKLDGGGLDGLGSFGANERFVFYSQANLDGENAAGLGAVDISSGGYCRWLYTTAATGPVRSIFEWRGKLFYTVDGFGVYREGDECLTDGWLKTSVFDLGSATRKVWDAVSIQIQPLPVDASVSVEYTYDGGGSYVSVPALSITSPGSIDGHAEPRYTAQSLGLRFTLQAQGTSPTVKLAQAKVHAFGLADTILKLPIDCGDTLSDMRGNPLRENGPGAGVRRYRFLESLCQAQVVIQDVDWQYTNGAEQFEVLQVEQRSIPAVTEGRRTGKAQLRSVALLTLRKANA